jgi:glycosyltransferase involved in cell wall biosynthesis
MKILHINSLNHKGGAWTIIKGLSQSLEDRGVKSYFIDGSKILNTKIPGYKKLMRIFNQYIFMDYISPLGRYLICRKIKEVSPDIIHLHNIHGGFFTTKLLLKLQEFAPVVWTFHDMFPITGHCAHSFDCEKWKDGCGKCPYPETYPEIRKDRTKAQLKYKKKVYDSSEFTIVVPSKWMYECVKKSILKDKDPRLINNGIYTDVFKKTDKIDARKKLDLPVDKKIILFSAHGGSKNPFKGGKYFDSVYEKLKHRKDLIFLNVGGEKSGGTENRFDVGYVDSAKEMALFYSASDVFLFPTLAESFGLVAVESMSCGCPVVSFETGGVTEIVEHLKTGFVAKYKDADDLIRGVELLLNDGVLNKEMADRGMLKAKENFSLDKMSEKYFELYKKVCKK